MGAEAALRSLHTLTGAQAVRHADEWTRALRGVGSVRDLPRPGMPAEAALRLMADVLSGDLLTTPVTVELPDVSAVREDAARMIARYGRARDGSVYAHVGETTLDLVRSWDLPSVVASSTGLRASPRLRLNFSRHGSAGLDLRLDSRRFGDLRLTVPLSPGGQTLVVNPWGVARYDGPVLLDGACTPHGRTPGPPALVLNVGIRCLKERATPHRTRA